MPTMLRRRKTASRLSSPPLERRPHRGAPGSRIGAFAPVRQFYGVPAPGPLVESRVTGALRCALTSGAVACGLLKTFGMPGSAEFRHLGGGRKGLFLCL